VQSTMTVEEMETRFPAEWLLVVDPQTDEEENLLRGKVVFHSQDRDEVYRKAIDLRATDLAFHFTGTIPEGTAVVL
jgi:hypothetical protein